MTKEQAVQARAAKLCRELGGLLVGEVPEIAADATLELWRIRACGEHLGAIVGFDERNVAVAQQPDELARNGPQIGDQAKAPTRHCEFERDLRRIMRNGNGSDFHRAHPERSARFVVAHLVAGAHTTCLDSSMEIDGGLQRTRKRLDLGDMITMLMGHHDGVHTTRKKRRRAEKL